MEPNVLSVLGQWGVAGAVVFQSWMLFKYLEGKDDDQIARNSERIAKLEAQLESQGETLEHHGKHKVGRETFSREVGRIDKRTESMQKHLEKHRPEKPA